MIIREKLAELLVRQESNNELGLDNLLGPHKEKMLQRSSEIIALFVEAIKGLEFKAPKHYHEKINSAFVFPPCKSYEVKT